MTKISFGSLPKFVCDCIPVPISLTCVGGTHAAVKITTIIAAVFAACSSGAALTGCASKSLPPRALPAQVKITREQAQQTALAQAPGGRVRQTELDDDQGELIWAFDIVTPGSTNLTEITVDAVTGGVISVATETPDH